MLFVQACPCREHFFWVALFVHQDVALDPVYMDLLVTIGIMLGAQDPAGLIQQFFGLSGQRSVLSGGVIIDEMLILI